MKLFILSISLVLSVNGIAQTAVTDTAAGSKITRWEAGKTYVDSVEMDMSKTYLDRHNIRSILKVQAEENKIYSAQKPEAILITRKKKQDFASPGDLKPQQTKGRPTLPVVYIINGTVIEDTTGVRLELSAIDRIDVLKDAEIAPSYRVSEITVLIKMKKTYKK